MIYIVTRHDATIEWIKSIVKERVRVVPHLDDDCILQMKQGDIVYGILPIHLIKRLLRKGITYYHVVLPNIPFKCRGKELTLSQIKKFGGQIWKINNIDCEMVK